MNLRRVACVVLIGCVVVPVARPRFALSEIDRKNLTFNDTWTDLSDSRIDVRRSYSSEMYLAYDGLFGKNWSSAFETRLRRRNHEMIIVWAGNRSEDAFQRDPRRIGPHYISATRGTLVGDNEGFEFVPRSWGADTVDLRTAMRFDRQGRLIRQGPANEPAFELAWDGGLLRRITSGGRAYEFDYNELGKVARVRAPNGRVTTYRYDARGNLLEAQDVRQNTDRFGYNDESRLVFYSAADATSTRLDYNERGSVNRVREYKAGKMTCDIRYEYGQETLMQYWTSKSSSCVTKTGTIHSASLEEWTEVVQGGQPVTAHYRAWSSTRRLTDRTYDVKTGRVVRETVTENADPFRSVPLDNP